MTTWWHQHNYALQISFLRLLKNPISSLTNIIIMSLALSVPITGFAIIQTLKPLQGLVNQNTEVTVFMTLDAAIEQVNTLQASLQKDYASSIVKQHVINREEAFNDLKNNPMYASALDTLDNNPLPHALVITVKPNAPSADVTALINKIKSSNLVDTMQYDQEWAQRLHAIIQFLQTGLWFIALIVGLALLLSVFNTVRIQALSQRAEIRVARLVGATESFVRRPFLYQGLLICCFSALGSIGFSQLILNQLNQALMLLAQSYGMNFAMRLPAPPELAIFVLCTALLGALSARWSVSKHSQF